MPDLAGKKTAYYGFTGLIEPATATRIATAFNHAVNSGYDEIHLCLSSTGGYVADGVFLYNRHYPDDLQVCRDHTPVPPSRELYSLCSHPMA